MNEKQAVMSEPAREAANVERTRAERYFSPDVDILETPEKIVVLADIPGADDQAVDITLENDVLRIETRAADHDAGNRRAALIEYDGGPFARSFLINNEIDRKGIEAKVRNGVLRVHLPKIQEARTRKIMVHKE